MFLIEGDIYCFLWGRGNIKEKTYWHSFNFSIAFKKYRSMYCIIKCMKNKGASLFFGPTRISVKAAASSKYNPV